jgi:riboflavin kinase/FMN adenylyltransferase
VTRWDDPAAVPADLPGSVVTIGVFDGVHRGHRVVVDRARAHADRLGLPLVVLTFEPHPYVVVRPDATPPAVSTVDHRVHLLQEAGADAVLVLRFDAERAAQSPDDFVTEILVERLRARAVVVGEDFRFGHRAAGDVELLAELGRQHGFAVDAVPTAGHDGVRWSSTVVRDRVIAGDVASAAEVLGHPFRVEGVVVEGDKRGRALGYPTANLPIPPGALVPADGVYAGTLTRLDMTGAPTMPAAVSVGSNPTFEGVQRRVEAYVLDRDDLELYGVPVAVAVVARLRGQERFDCVADLVAQMGRDVDATRVALAARPPAAATQRG